MKLGTVIRKYRVTSELTLREVGQEIGIGAATLMRLEQGRDMDSRTMAKILAWLFAGDAVKNGSKSRERK